MGSPFCFSFPRENPDQVLPTKKLPLHNIKLIFIINYSQAFGLMCDGEELSFILLSQFRNRELPCMTWQSHLFVICLEYPLLIDFCWAFINPVDLLRSYGSFRNLVRLISSAFWYTRQMSEPLKLYNSLWVHFSPPTPRCQVGTKGMEGSWRLAPFS